MSLESLRSYPHRLYAHWNAGDMEAFYAMIDEHVHDAGGNLRGRDQVRAVLDAVRAAFPDSRYTVEHVIADGEWLAVRLEFTGTQHGPLFGWSATNKRATWKEIRYCRIVDDKTLEHYAVIDNFGMLEQLGHVHSPARSTW
ncbi:MAG: ester cyclase [Myxococcaceae bacterium]|nr:ester cyclase [Myxococcaceae bacterium]